VQIDLNQFRGTFFQEVAEHLETMESALLALQAGKGDNETLHAIFRCAHSTKAGAGTFGFETMARFTHVLESLLDRMRNAEIAVTTPRVELLLRSVDVLRTLVDAAGRGETPPPVWREVIEELDRLRGAEALPEKVTAPAAPPDSPRETCYEIRFEPGPELLRLSLDPFLVLRDLAELGKLSAEADVSRLPALEDLDTETCYLGWRLHLETDTGMDRIRDVFAFCEDVATIAIDPVNAAAAPPPAEAESKAPPKTDLRAAPREASIRVATEKVDRLIDLVGELMIAQSMAAEIMNGFTADRLPCLREAVAEIARHTRELQDRAMRIRMMPVGTIFSRFPRLVHDTAKALGKQVSLEIGGEETELDKGVVERMADPLTHLVRNAVDHGIELPADRLRAGKPAEGSLRLTAYHQGGNVIIEVADDGRGLDTARIRAKGIERGLIAAEDELSDEQIHALIFRPGFSTAERVSDLSGRGVGMDVVKKAVDALNGSVAIATERGRGATIRFKLPLTLAILDGLLLRLGEQTYVLPLVSIVESIRPRPEQVRDVAGRGEVVVVRKEPLPLLRLGGLLHIPTEVSDPARGLVVIVEHEGRRVALLVDELLGQQQVVVKSLETNFRKVEGIAGATILGDGRAALILDIAGLVALSRGELLSNAAA
jgi:two-component system chemotaxis sensor kinase CheA